MGKWKGPPLELIPKCRAHAKHSGLPCKRFAMKNGRCDIHGGKSTGAKNPHREIKHGRYTKEAIAHRKILAKLIKDSRVLIGEID